MIYRKLLLGLLFIIGVSFSMEARSIPFAVELDTIPVKERYENFLTAKKNPFDLKDPSIIEKTVEYDPKTGLYVIMEKIGDDYYRMPTYMTFQEYLKYRDEEQQKKQFQKFNTTDDAKGNRLLSETGKNGIGIKFDDPLKKMQELIEKNVVDRLFGGTELSIVPQGNVDITLAPSYTITKNPALPIRSQRQFVPLGTSSGNQLMNINMNVTGKIGEKMNLNTSFNNQAAFNFDNQIKLNYNTNNFSEDEIIKDIGAGNVTLPLKSTLIQGASSLFGLKLGTQFGRLKLTTVVAQQQSRRQQIQVKQGGQKYKFQINGDQYDENRHFFLTQSNRDNYEKALVNLPQINSLFSITYLEVWVTNDRTETQNVRDIIAFADLGEPEKFTNTKVKKGITHNDINGKPLPANDANTLYDKLLGNSRLRNFDGAIRELTKKGGDFEMQPTKDFEKVRARKLRPDEFSYDPKLGYISVNFQLRPNQTLGVAFTYKYNGKEFKVGELAGNAPATELQNNTATKTIDTIPQMLFVKLLKATTPRLDVPLWDLMMKNVYSLGASNVTKDGFRLEIMYNKPGDGERRFLPSTKLAGVPLLQVFNLDKLNVQGDPQPDGVFDFVEGITINTRQGKIIFPVLEPFGKTLSTKIADPSESRFYVYQQLYDTTVTAAREFPELNVFSLKGEYKGTSNSEYQLGTFNLPKGSVKVTSGGQPLIEGSDYEVNYSTGTVKILNEAYVNSAVPVNISFEDSQLFGFQQKRMFGTRWDYAFNKDIAIGGTLMKLWEVPFTQKVNINEDPISNTVYGLDINYNKDAPWITKAIDRLPFISTKAPSSVSFTGEIALLKPGHARAINKIKDANNDNEVVDDNGVVYIDDFEGSTNGTDLRTPYQWFLSSVPQNDLQNNNPRFPEADYINSRYTNLNRAKLMWYNINEQGGAGISTSNNPKVRTGSDDTNPYYGFIAEEEVFPRKDYGQSVQGTFPFRVFDLTYLPSERGPYNYDEPGTGVANLSKGLDNNGNLNNPETRWAGIMRALPYNDFEASNVEFIDLWVLSPYLIDNQSRFNKGKLHIDLGNISEDILRDSRQFYENGLPGGVGTTASRFPTDQTMLGRVPRITPITNAFDLDPAVRDAQDVGLDGWNDAGETKQVESYLTAINNSNLPTAVKTKINQDPANDNFRHFLNASYTDQDGVLERYHDYNNTQGNSEASNNSTFVTSGTNIPDSEDLDNNKSLDNEGESYFHYEVPFEFDQVTVANPGGLNIAKAGFVADIVKVKPEVKARWTDIDQAAEPVFYRIRIPIDQFKKKVGGIQDFRSIRFMRMYLTDFEKPVTLRFARMELSRSQWRRYKRNQIAGGDPPFDPGTDPIKDNTLFDINAINYEENGNRPNYRYTIPPGIQREQVLGQAVAQTVKQNEQSISMNVCNLQPEAERGIYKIVNLDTRLYQRMKMFVHAEPKMNQNIKPGELTAYIRLGNDFVSNYYEYEVPLTMSDLATLQAMKDADTNPAYAREIWLASNSFNINLQDLVKLKEERNKASYSFKAPFTRVSNERNTDSMTIKGNPNLGAVKSIMIGLRNRSENNICAEVWVNELRVNGFDEQGGVAGLARLDVKMADLGRATFSTNYTGVGWGSIEQRLQQRSREQIFQYDITTNLELGKFLPQKIGLKIPFTYQYSNNTRTPEYDPYDLDVKLKQKLADTDNSKVRDSIRNQAVTIDKISNISFDNVRVERNTDSKKKPMPWNISNFSVSYQQSENQYSDPIISSQNKKTRRGQLDYNYSIPNGLNITPFKKSIKKDKYLKFISEFNFSPLPSTLSFNTNIERQLNTTKYRFTESYDSLSTYYNKRFAWDRKYTMNWDFSKGIKMTYNSDVTSVIDEPDGRIDTKTERDSIFTNIKNLGRYKTFAQNIGLNYTLPTKQIPFMDWINVRAQNNITYNWNAAALNTQFLGNTIRNSQNRTINGEFNFEQLYNQSKYLKKINTPIAAKTKKPSKPKNTAGPANAGTLTDNPSDNAKGRDASLGQPEDQRARLREKMKQGRTAEDVAKTDAKGNTKADTSGVKIGKDGKPIKADAAKADKKAKDKKEKEHEPSMAERVLIRPLMLLRKASLTYSENYQNTVPGFMPNTGILGQENFTSPGWDFILGGTPSDQWLDNAAQKNWITNSNLLNESVVRNYTQQIQGRVTIEPFTDFKIDVELTKNYTKNHTEDFKRTDATADFAHLTPRDIGSFTVSYFSLDGLFGGDAKTLDLYQKYNDYGKVVSARLAGPGAKPHPQDQGFYTGYGRTNADVAIPAFMAAYTGKDPNTVNLNIFKTMPLPNYRLNYNGLGKLKPLKDKVQSISITHGYKSQLQLNSYNTNTPDFDNTNPYKRDAITGSYYTALNIPGVVLNREFSPLIGVDVKLKNDLSLRVDIKKRYNLQMSFIDSQLSEQKQDDYTVGFGYKMKNVHLKFFDFLNFEQNQKNPKKPKKERKNSIIKLKSLEDAQNAKPELDKNGKPIKKKKAKKGSDLDLKCDFTLTDGVTYQTGLLTGVRVPVRGEYTVRVSPSASYAVNKLLTLRFFMDYNQTKPKISSSIPTTRISGGVQLRFQLQ